MITAAYIAVMAAVTYLIRMIPFTAFRGKIKSDFVKSFLHYIPYAVLSAMTIPDIFYSTGENTVCAAVGTAAAVILAYFDMPLIVVAIAAAGAALLTGFIV